MCRKDNDDKYYVVIVYLRYCLNQLLLAHTFCLLNEGISLIINVPGKYYKSSIMHFKDTSKFNQLHIKTYTLHINIIETIVGCIYWVLYKEWTPIYQHCVHTK